MPNNWLNNNAPAHCKFSDNYGPQIIGRFPTLLGLNLKELQKFQKLIYFQNIEVFCTENIQKTIIEGSMMYRKSNELAAKRSGSSF